MSKNQFVGNFFFYFGNKSKWIAIEDDSKKFEQSKLKNRMLNFSLLHEL